MKDFKYWVDHLDLLPHPEGGFYKETYRSQESIDHAHLPERFGGGRNFSTAIYFMLTDTNFSAFHRIQADELWHFYTGNSITVSLIYPDGKYEEIKLGSDIENGEVFQAMVPAGVWFGSRMTHGQGYGLVGCTVAPGFDFADFEMAERQALLREFPEHETVIRELTR